jgi:hypothetical protein
LSPAAQRTHRVGIVLALLAVVAAWVLGVAAAQAAPGLCVGPVCGDLFSRSSQMDWQLHLRIEDQRGQRERIVVDCRHGEISPQQGPIERGHVAAVARRVCRLVNSAVSSSDGEDLGSSLLQSNAGRA